jgi:hypothetical protein
MTPFGAVASALPHTADVWLSLGPSQASESELSVTVFGQSADVSEGAPTAISSLPWRSQPRLAPAPAAHESDVTRKTQPDVWFMALLLSFALPLREACAREREQERIDAHASGVHAQRPTVTCDFRVLGSGARAGLVRRRARRQASTRCKRLVSFAGGLEMDEKQDEDETETFLGGCKRSSESCLFDRENQSERAPRGSAERASPQNTANQ